MIYMVLKINKVLKCVFVVWGDDLHKRNQPPRLVKSMKVKDIASGSLSTFILAETGHLYQWTIGKVGFSKDFLRFV